MPSHGKRLTEPRQIAGSLRSRRAHKGQLVSLKPPPHYTTEHFSLGLKIKMCGIIRFSLKGLRITPYPTVWCLKPEQWKEIILPTAWIVYMGLLLRILFDPKKVLRLDKLDLLHSFPHIIPLSHITHFTPLNQPHFYVS